MSVLSDLFNLVPIIFSILKLIYLFRNINTVRSVVRIHGDPIDRYYLMAAVATQGAYNTPMQQSVLHLWIGWLDKLRLDLKLK